MHPSAFRLPPSALLAFILAIGGLPASGQSLLKSHGHNNLPVLQKLTAPGGVLTYDGSAVGGSVTLAGTPDYITISGSTITRAAINLSSHVTGTLPVANGGTGITALGTGIATALGVNVGSAGAPVLFDGAGGTPSSLTLTNATGLPAAGVIGTALTLSGGTLTGQLIQSRNGAASTPPIALTGTWYSGGSATTTKPQLLIEPTGTTSTGWSTAGTGIGVNAPSGFAGAFLDLALDGTSHFLVSHTTGGFRGGYGGDLQMQGNIEIGSLAGLGYGRVYAGSYGVRVGSDLTIGFMTQATSYAAVDTVWARDAAGVMQQSEDVNGSPMPQGHKAHDGITGTDIAGANLSLAGGSSTGTGRGGDLISKTANSSTSGTTANSYTTREYHAAKWVDLTESTATTVANVAVASGKYAGLRMICTITADDATDYQSLTSEVTLDAVNKAGTVTTTITQGDNTTAASAGTLTCTYTAVVNGSSVDIKANAASSLTQSTLRAKWSISVLNTNGTDTTLTTGSTVTPQ